MTRKILTYTLLVLGSVVAIVPFLVTILASLKTKTELIQGVLSLPEKAQWSNYSTAWTQGHFDRFFVNSILVAIGVVIPSVLLSAMSGYAFARFKFRGSKFLFTYLLIGLVIPLQAMVIPLFYLLRELNLLDSLWALILPQVGMSMSFGTLLMRQAYLSIPREIMEASICDGANSWETLWKIMFPLSRPIVGTLGLLFFIWTWNEFLIPLTFLVSNDNQTVPIAISLLQGDRIMDVTTTSASALLGLIPTLIFFLIFQRTLTRGITAGAVK